MRRSSVSFDAAVILAIRIVGAALWMVYAVILARMLPPETFAQVIYVINFTLVASLIVTLGRDVALLRFASQRFAKGELRAVRQAHQQARKWVGAAGAVLTAALVLASFSDLKTPITSDISIAVLAGLIATALGLMNLNRDVLRAARQIWQSQLGFNITRAIVPMVGVIIAAVFSTLSAQIALALFLFALVMSLAIEAVFLSVHDWSAGPTPAPHSIGKDSLTLWPGDVANAVQMRIAGLIGGFYFAPEVLALFLVAERVAALAQFPIAAASQAVAPRISASTDSAALRTALRTGSKVMTIGGLLGVAGAAVALYPLLWLFGPSYVEAAGFVFVFLGAHLSWAVFGLAQPALHQSGHFKAYAKTAVACATVSVSTIWFAATGFGPLATAGAFCVSWWMTNAAYTFVFFQKTKQRTGIFAILRKA